MYIVHRFLPSLAVILVYLDQVFVDHLLVDKHDSVYRLVKQVPMSKNNFFIGILYPFLVSVDWVTPITVTRLFSLVSKLNSRTIMVPVGVVSINDCNSMLLLLCRHNSSILTSNFFHLISSISVSDFEVVFVNFTAEHNGINHRSNPFIFFRY